VRIASRHNRFVVAVASGDDAVSKDPAFPLREDDVADLDLQRRTAAHHENVAGSDRRKHAVSVRPQARLAGLAEEFSEQFRDGRQEFLLLDPPQAPPPEVLPQASAMVSKSRSRTNSGF
jgi:hypothetical protein